MFALLHLLSPSWKQYCAEMAMSKVLTYVCIILCININEFYNFWWLIDDFYINYNISFVTSRYLATGDAITTIAHNFQMSVSTARQIIFDVCTAIWDVLAPIYMPVPSEDKWKSIADEFYERWNFLNCIGATDGK